jgi:hypothetical protein
MSKRGRALLFIGCCVAAVGGAVVRWHFVRLHLANQAARPITEIRLSGRCFDRSLSRLEADDSRTFWVRPCGESSVDLAFRSGTEVVAKRHLGYIEGGGGYSMELGVRADLDVTIRTHLWPFGL